MPTGTSLGTPRGVGSRVLFPPQWSIGGIFLTGIGALLLGVVVMAATSIVSQPSSEAGLPKRTAEQMGDLPLPGDANELRHRRA